MDKRKVTLTYTMIVEVDKDANVRDELEELMKEGSFIPVKTNVRVNTGKDEIADEDVHRVLHQAKRIIRDRLIKET